MTSVLKDSFCCQFQNGRMSGCPKSVHLLLMSGDERKRSPNLNSLSMSVVILKTKSNEKVLGRNSVIIAEENRLL